MKKVLIIGASILQLPAIKKAKELGYYVGVVDYNPKAIGIPYADEFFNVSTIDIEGVVEVAKSFEADGVMTLATDMPMRSIAAAATELNLPGISMDVAIKATDKGEMIKCFEEHNVEHPWYYIIKNLEELNNKIDLFEYPCIMKPTDNSGSRGVFLANNKEELIANYNYVQQASRGGTIIIEEFLQGNEVSVEVIVIEGTPYVLQVTDKITTGAPHFVEMGHNQPSNLPDYKVLQIKDLAVRAVKAIGIKNGPAHVEIMVTEKGPKMIELGARMGGDCITTHLVPLSTGIDMIKATIEIALGNKPDIAQKINKYSAIRYFKTANGIIKQINGVKEAREISGVKEISFTKEVGDTVDGIGSSADRVGFVIVQADSLLEIDEILTKVFKTVDIIVK